MLFEKIDPALSKHGVAWFSNVLYPFSREEMFHRSYIAHPTIDAPPWTDNYLVLTFYSRSGEYQGQLLVKNGVDYLKFLAGVKNVHRTSKSIQHNPNHARRGYFPSASSCLRRE